MAKRNTAAAVADTTTTGAEATSTASDTQSGSEATSESSGDSEEAGASTKSEATGEAASSGVDLVDTAAASPVVESAVGSVDGGGASDAAAIGEGVGLGYGAPRTAIEALELVKQFYPQAEFAQAVAELNGASAAAASSISATAISDDNFYRVLSPLEHNHKVYGIGATVLLTDDEAAPLLGRTVEAI